MMPRLDGAERLDLLLAACEEAVLEASDRSILSEADWDVDATRNFIAARLAERPAAALPAPRSRRSSRSAAGARAIPRDAAGRRRLLGRLIASRPEIPTRISLAFKSREPEDVEVAELLQELLNSGERPEAE